MSRKRSKTRSILSILILCVAVALWIWDASDQGDLRKHFERDAIAPTQTVEGPRGQQPKSTHADKKSTGRYEVFKNCTLVTDRGNDGDSFLVKLPNGRSEIMRLYFVDAPESAFKTYGGGRNNHERISQQATALGRITSKQAVEIGKEAKDFVLTHLGKAPFTIYTEWNSPFKDKRYHAFVILDYKRQPRFLHEVLVEKGFARIHTKGSELPDGTSRRKQEDRLLNLQRTAQSQKTGVWNF